MDLWALQNIEFCFHLHFTQHLHFFCNWGCPILKQGCGSKNVYIYSRAYSLCLCFPKNICCLQENLRNGRANWQTQRTSSRWPSTSNGWLEPIPSRGANTHTHAHTQSHTLHTLPSYTRVVASWGLIIWVADSRVLIWHWLGFVKNNVYNKVHTVSSSSFKMQSMWVKY